MDLLFSPLLKGSRLQHSSDVDVLLFCRFYLAFEVPSMPLLATAYQPQTPFYSRPILTSLTLHLLIAGCYKEPYWISLIMSCVSIGIVICLVAIVAVIDSSGSIIGHHARLLLCHHRFVLFRLWPLAPLKCTTDSFNRSALATSPSDVLSTHSAP